MPLSFQSLDNHIRDWFLTTSTFATVPLAMAVHAPSISILLHEGSRRIERVATFRAKEMANVPLTTTCEDDFTLDWCLATSAPGAELLMEI